MLTTLFPCWTITAASSLSCCTYIGEWRRGEARLGKRVYEKGVEAAGDEEG